MSKKNIKKLSIAAGVVLVLIICFGIFNLAKSFVIHGYSSGEIVLENVDDNGSDVVLGGEDNISYTPSDDTTSVKIDTMYDSEGIVLKSKEYLGQEYYDYEAMFKKIVEGGDNYFLGLDTNSEYVFYEKDYPDGFMVSTGLWGNEEVSTLGDYDYIKISSLDSGLKSVYFYDGNKVIYKLNTAEPSFFVVDYSNLLVDSGMDLAKLGGVVGGEVYLVPSICNKQEIEGYTVYFSYFKDVYIEYNID